jgi:site-specific DNA-cytosine methylase
LLLVAAAKDCAVYTNPVYLQYCKDFHKKNKQNKRKKHICVLDLFSGIGSGTVVLKKLKLPISTVVHVEHDTVAVEISKFNHKNDGIQHVYVEKFEHIYGWDNHPDMDAVGKVIKENGPFDLVLGAAPCQNYSEVNAHRSKENESAKYLVKIGILIDKINQIQAKEYNVQHVLFLSENVIFHKDLEEVNKCYGEMGGFGLQPIQLDAKDFSPCKRNRFYWSNVSATFMNFKQEKFPLSNKLLYRFLLKVRKA